MASLEQVLEATGLPFTETQWAPRTPPQVPYIVYQATNDANFAADNIVYVAFTLYDIELYTSKRDKDTEALVEAALKSNGIYYEKVHTWIEREAMYQVVYSVKVQGG